MELDLRNKKSDIIKSILMEVVNIVLITVFVVVVFLLGQYIIKTFNFIWTGDVLKDVNNNYKELIRKLIRIGHTAFYVNMVFLTTFIFGLYVIFDNILVATIVPSVLMIIIGISEALALKYRGESWTLADIRLVGDGMAALRQYKFFINIEVIIAVVVLFVLFILIYKFIYKNLKVKEPVVVKIIKKVVYIGVFAFMIYMSVGVYGKLNTDGFISDEIYSRGVSGRLFLGLKYSVYKQSSEYNTEKVKELYNMYEQKLIEENQNSVKDNVTNNKNVIVLVCESFSNQFDFLIGESSTPYLSSLNAINAQGYASHRQDLTSRAEFSVLTGLNLCFDGNVPFTDYPDLMSSKFLDTYKKNNYYMTAVHLCSKDVYKYKKAYVNIGFDKTIFLEDTNVNGEGFVPRQNDSLFNILENLVDEKEPDQKQFIYAVTTMGHDASDANKYKGTVKSFHDKLTNMNDKQKDFIEDVFVLNQVLDNSIRNFIEKLKEKDEEYVVVILGDHSYRIDVALTTDKMFSSRFDGGKIPIFIYDTKENIGKSYIGPLAQSYILLYVNDLLNIKDNVYTFFLREMKKLISAFIDGHIYSERLKRFIPYNEADVVEKEFMKNYRLIYDSYFSKEDKHIFFGNDE